MTTPTDPTSVTVAQMRAAYDALGLDLERFNSTRLIEIMAHQIRVTRYVLDAKGYMIRSDEDNEPWNETLTIPLAVEPTAGVGPCNVITSKGREATQTIRHLHLHVVPRREGDGLALPWTKEAPDGGE